MLNIPYRCASNVMYNIFFLVVLLFLFLHYLYDCKSMCLFSDISLLELFTVKVK